MVVYIGFKINTLSSLNNNNEVDAEINNNTLYIIDRATLISDNNIIPKNKKIIIESNELLEIFPNQIKTSSTFYLNPNGESTNEDFLFTEYPIEANLSAEIPLRLIAEDLVLIDTTVLDFKNSNELDIEKIYLSIENELPFDAAVELILLDENNIIIDTLIYDATILAGEINENNIITNSSLTNIEMEYNDFQGVNKIVSISAFSTKPTEKFIDIYSDYGITITLSGKIKNNITE